MFSRSNRSEKAAVAPRSSSEDGAYVQDPAAVEYDSDLHVECPPHTTERRLVNRIDFRVIPYLCILYLLAFLDRVNIANANVFGLSEELGLASANSMKYNTALVIFFVPYVLFEIPSNVLMKKFKPNVWLSGCMFFFGLVTILQGLVRNYSGLLTTRFFLGVFETGMFPGCFYLIGMWYRRHEAQRRYSFFFSSTTLAGAFGGLLASAIGKMDGVRGYKGWRWIFILEGLLTVIVSLVFFFLIPNFPEEAKWLSEDEKRYVKARLQADQGRSAAERKITLRDVGHVFKDPKVWIGGFMYFGLIVPAYGYAYFSPAIIKSYGYSAIQTQLHSVPPWAAAFGFAMIVAYLSDKLRHRFLFTILPIAVAIAGFAILLAEHHNLDLQYAALFLVAMGCYSAMPVIVCWFNMNLGGHHRRSVGSAWQVGFGNIGGIIAVFSFLSKDAPRYTPGHSICIAFICLSALSCAIYWVLCSWSNRKRDKTPTDLGLTEYEKTEMGDLSPDYRYLL
ncbi:Major facilitator superfamily [Botryosphaeria dothidea]|uniref:Major facilitator superfamily n=1 Tax=Botryosphaeria dothidea TaxID=55169 RepID=A0A8H4JAR3_9PEZI|nr:Major facilitator superfamily [Botryosphaeria dothidea]